jgi:hypothetical protein
MSDDGKAINNKRTERGNLPVRHGSCSDFLGYPIGSAGGAFFERRRRMARTIK